VPDVRRALIALLVAAAMTAVLTAEPPTSAPAVAADFGRDVMPILETNCLRCHNTAKAEGGLLVESHEDLLRGGDSGSPIVAGQPDESPFILQVEGRAKPKMPPKADLAPDEIAVLRAWVAAGAKYSPVPRPSLDERVPALTQAAPVKAQATSVAWRPDGAELAVAGYRQVQRVGMPEGAVVGRFDGLHDQVRSVAFSPDGTLVAAGGGTPGAFGEIVLYESATGQIRARLDGHRDYVYHVAFSRDGTRLASCGYDRLIRVWDTSGGKLTAVLKEHTEAVYAVAFSDDGKVLASAAADRSVKIWKVDDGTRLYTITDPTDAVLTLAFRPGTRQLAAGGQDKRVRVWEIGDTAARPLSSRPAHSAAVLRLAFSRDGRQMATTGADRVVTIWNADSGEPTRVMAGQSDWAQGLSFSPDGRQLAVGRYDGSVSVYDTATGTRASDVLDAGKVAQR
jgi:dipeptidyl aminopeptidase/acylaminoacyl peptidase